MDSLPFVKLNESNMTQGMQGWQTTSDEVRRALETHGCLVVECKLLQNQSLLHKDVFNLFKELFDLPIETKREHKSELTGFGYGGNYAIMPLFEYFGIEDDKSFEGVNYFTHLMWSHGNTKFSKTIYSYCKLLSELHQTVLKMVFSSYGLEEHYNSLLESELYMIRIIKYRASGSNVDNVGLIPHRDKDFMVVISTNEVKGLQIEMPNGNWIDFEPSPSKFIIIAGEAFMAWSNERIYCPLHKVIARGNHEKYSIGVFSFIKGVLEVPKELVDDENPLKFKAFNNLDFIEYCKDGGETMTRAIHTYCGI